MQYQPTTRDFILAGAFEFGRIHVQRGVVAKRAFFGEDVSMFNEYVRGRADALGCSLEEAFAPYAKAVR